MIGRAIRAYADTSVFGGVHDAVFAEASRVFFSQVREGRFQLVVSDLVEKELREAPEPVRTTFDELLPGVEVAGDTDHAVLLQKAYLEAGVVPRIWMDDALHVALATVSECAVSVSGNFKHIVNLKRIPLYNAVNLMHGYQAIEIRFPWRLWTMMKTAKRPFDCVAMMHRGAALVRQEIGACSLEEKMEYWRKGTEALRQQQELLRKKRPRSHKGGS